MASEVDSAPLVGRADQLATLRAALHDDIGPGQTAAVFVTGESGVGKTRLLTEAAARLRDAGAVVLTGSCLDIGDASPLHPVLQALRRFDADLTAAQARTSSAVRGLLRTFAEDSSGADSAGALLERVSRGLSLIAEGRPLVLVLDDLQWVDRTTRQLLLYLLAGLGDLQLSVLAAVRAESLQGAHPLRRVLTELRRLRSVRVLDLAPLDRADTDRLAGEIVGTPLAPEAADQVWQRSGGNPFVVEELARDLRDGRDGLSDTLREIFLSRVDVLPRQAHAAVHAVAAGVEPVEHWLLAEVLGLPEPELIEALREAVAHRLLVGADDGYRLRHRLVAEVLAHELLPAERAGLHRRYAEALTQAPAELHQARLAHHWRLAGEPARALPAAMAAAREAQRLHGFAEAHRHWSAALQLAATPTSGPGAYRPRSTGRCCSNTPPRPPTRAASTPGRCPCWPSWPGVNRSIRPAGCASGGPATWPPPAGPRPPRRSTGGCWSPSTAPRGNGPPPPPNWPICWCSRAATPTPVSAPGRPWSWPRRSTGAPTRWCWPARRSASARRSWRTRTRAWPWSAGPWRPPNVPVARRTWPARTCTWQSC
nr:AAA family ATPase [Micromonospora sp. RL09-050-HVF-A]